MAESPRLAPILRQSDDSSENILESSLWNFAALQVVAMLKAVFNIQSDVWSRFTERLEDKMVAASSGFWHHVSSDSVGFLPQQTLQGLLGV